MRITTTDIPRPWRAVPLCGDESRCACISASRAKMPPSPWLSAFVMNPRYFTLTTSTRDQKMSDNIPSMPSMCDPSGKCVMHSFIV